MLRTTDVRCLAILATKGPTSNYWRTVKPLTSPRNERELLSSVKFSVRALQTYESPMSTVAMAMSQ